MKNILLNERFILTIIFLNTIVIFIQGFEFDSQHISKIEYFDNFFTLVFVLELISKIKYFGISDYFKSNWNKFDFTLVVIALPSLASVFLPFELFSLDFLLAFRILRVLKFFRFIRFIPNIDHILKGIIRASKASVLIIIGFFVFNFTISLVSCFLFKNIAPQYFSDPIVSFYSIFKIFTIEGWYEIPETITDSIHSNAMSFLVKMYFICVLFFGGIFGLSLVNSIFVESMMSDNNENVENKIELLTNKVDELIEKFNSNKSD